MSSVDLGFRNDATDIKKRELMCVTPSFADHILYQETRRASGHVKSTLFDGEMADERVADGFGSSISKAVSYTHLTLPTKRIV